MSIVLAAVEGTASYGASLTRTLGRENITVVEVKPPRKEARAGVGKTDEIDATAVAMGILGKDLEQLLQPRSDGVRAAAAFCWPAGAESISSGQPAAMP